MVHSEDRTTLAASKPPTTDSPLNTFAQTANLIDYWRQFHPLNKEYTFHSAAHGRFSRIDYFLGAADMTAWVDDAEIHEIVISDHSPISLTIRDTARRPNYHHWRFPSHLETQESFKAFLLREWLLYSDMNDSSKDNLTLYWEAGKAFMRGRIIAYTVGYKKEKMKRFLESSKILREKQHAYQENRGQQHKEEWEKAKSNFEMAEQLYEQAIAHANTLKFHNHGNKAGKLLACLTKAPHGSNYIRAMKDKDGVTQTDPKKINTALTDFYTELYKRDPLTLRRRPTS